MHVRAPSPATATAAADMATAPVRGAELRARLGEQIRAGHVDRTYRPTADELFLRADDVDGDDLVGDMYTGELRGPVRTSSADAWALDLSVEHTWPRALGARSIAESDLHHLRAADKATNTRRGTYRYGEVVQPTWSTKLGPAGEQSRLGVDALGDTVFEPAASVRGDIARGLLYFYTRYVDERPRDFTTINFRRELPTLLRWHEQDPVSAEELERNGIVEAFQGNRNPYVDQPGLVRDVGLAGFGG